MEPGLINVGHLFLGIGGMVVLLVFAHLIFQLTRLFKTMADKETKYDLFEEMIIDDCAKKKGFNLEQEMIKRDLMHAKRKNLRRKLEEEVYNNIFPEQIKK